VCQLAYLHFEHGPLFISESSFQQEYEFSERQYEWTDEEIAAIRLVLQRLTALRITDSNDAEDLVQDTLLTMITKHPVGGLEKGPLIWSMGILRKKVGNYYRKAQRYSSLCEREVRTRQRIQQSKLSCSPEVKMIHEELQAIVGETLAQLPPSQREAMELLIAGLDPGEIVARLHPERYQNVINRIHRARKKLAKELAKYGYGPNAKAGIRRLRSCRITK
jgi:RNA polymerase sigma factor (sigma-70 family)